MPYTFNYKEAVKYSGTPRFKTSEEFGKAVQEYFELADSNKSKLTITALRNHLNVCKETWNGYMQGCPNAEYLNDEEKRRFKIIAKKAKDICEEYTLDKCLDGGKATIANIFVLKCNYDYIETVQQINVDKTIKVIEKSEGIKFDND